MHFPVLTLRLAVALAVLTLAACGGDDDSNEPDAQAGTGGVGGSSGSGGSGSDAGGTGGATDAGGTSGSDAAVGRDASIDDVDLTLGGFNQDLAAPSIDCLTRENLALGCMAISGEYNGMAFELQCADGDIIVAVGGNQHFVKEPFVLGGELDIRLLLRRQLLAMPAVTFTVDSSTSGDAYSTVYYPTRNVVARVLADTHDRSVRVAGISDLVPGWRIDGTFASSLIPKSTCVPDAMGLGCDVIRLRGNFRVLPNEPPP